MRSIAAIGVGLAMTATAHAADYLRGTQADPVYSPVPAHTWEGSYFGVHAAYNSGNFNPTRQAQQLETEALAGTIVQPNLAGMFRLQRTSEGKFSGGFFLGHNWQFEDVVYGLEGELNIARLSGTTSRINGGTFQNLVPDTIIPTAAAEPAGTYTVGTTSGFSNNRIKDYGIIKARAGYAMGRILPFMSVGIGIARVETDASVTLDWQTYQRINNFNTVTTIDPLTGVPTITRTTYIGQTTPLVAAASGVRVVATRQSAYKPGIAVGLGVDWSPWDNFFMRAEYQALLIGSFEGVQNQIHSARVGGGMKF